MANTNTDKPLALRTSIICAVLIAAVFTLIGSLTNQLSANWHNPVYKIVVIVASIAFLIASFAAYKFADDGRYDNLTTIIVVALTGFIILWACIWMAAAGEKVSPGSRQMEDVEKSDSLYTDSNHLPTKIPQ
jgi:cellobiose-specific phosphotransferase system component IIC